MDLTVPKAKRLMWPAIAKGAAAAGAVFIIALVIANRSRGEDGSVSILWTLGLVIAVEFIGVAVGSATPGDPVLNAAVATALGVGLAQIAMAVVASIGSGSPPTVGQVIFFTFLCALSSAFGGIIAGRRSRSAERARFERKDPHV